MAQFGQGSVLTHMAQFWQVLWLSFDRLSQAKTKNFNHPSQGNSGVLWLSFDRHCGSVLTGIVGQFRQALWVSFDRHCGSVLTGIVAQF